MKVYINARFTMQTITGVQRYAWEVSNHLGERKEFIKPGRLASSSGALGHIWEQCSLPIQLPRKGLLWSPAGAGPLLVEKQIVTLHDIAHLEHPEWYDAKYSSWYQYLIPKLTKKVVHILTVSNYSKERIIDVLGIAPEKITVSPNGVEPRFFNIPAKEIESVRKKYHIKDKYILAVSAISPRKNFRVIVQAWDKIKSKFPNYSLVIAGKSGLAFARNASVDISPEQVNMTGYVKEEDLPALYAGASLFVYPSLYEGFGIPILEAMATGTPVITSNITSMPEVAGDAAVLVNPIKEDEVAEAIELVLTDERLHKELGKKGRKRAGSYTWERTTNTIYELMKKHM